VAKWMPTKKKGRLALIYFCNRRFLLVAIAIVSFILYFRFFTFFTFLQVKGNLLFVFKLTVSISIYSKLQQIHPGRARYSVIVNCIAQTLESLTGKRKSAISSKQYYSRGIEKAKSTAASSSE
jgi:hypothetical protein